MSTLFTETSILIQYNIHYTVQYCLLFCVYRNIQPPGGITHADAFGLVTDSSSETGSECGEAEPPTTRGRRYRYTGVIEYSTGTRGHRVQYKYTGVTEYRYTGVIEYSPGTQGS